MKVLSPSVQLLLTQYIQVFQALRNQTTSSLVLINDFDNTSSENGNAFFEKYGVGNELFVEDRPYERMRAYELLLYILFQYDASKFQTIFKGTPYYFLGWTAFQIGDYEKGIFYMDAAMTEDLVKNPFTLNYDFHNAETLTPAIRFLLLNSTTDIALMSTSNLGISVSNEILEFSQLTQKSINVDNVREKLIVDSGLIRNHAFRTIITSFYTFILEYQERKNQIHLRSAEGGTTEPFLLHLLKGCVIWESLLKQKAPRATTIEQAMTQLFPDFEIQHGRQSLDRALSILSESQDKSSIATTFNVSFSIRNTVSHNLFWTDIFRDDNYEALYKSVCRAILWSVYELWIK